jgi:mercuric ion transport protein
VRKPIKDDPKMTDNPNPAGSDAAPVRDTGALLLAAGGLAAAFGAASCCALPVLLTSLGLGSAWLVTVAWFAAPYRIALLVIAIACLAGGGGLLLWRRRRPLACASDGPRGQRVITTTLATGILSAAAILVVLGFVYA